MFDNFSSLSKLSFWSKKFRNLVCFASTRIRIALQPLFFVEDISFIHKALSLVWNNSSSSLGFSNPSSIQKWSCDMRWILRSGDKPSNIAINAGIPCESPPSWMQLNHFWLSWQITCSRSVVVKLARSVGMRFILLHLMHRRTGLYPKRSSVLSSKLRRVSSEKVFHMSPKMLFQDSSI